MVRWERFHRQRLGTGARVAFDRGGGNMFGFDLMELGVVAAVIVVITGGLAVVVSLVRWVVHLKVMEEQLEDQLEVLSEMRKQLARVVTLLDK